MKQEILNLEETLRHAMLEGDTAKLDELIDDSLIFIAPNGVVANKQMDLDAHKSGIQKMSDIIFSERKMELNENLAIVTVIADIKGIFADVDISGKYRYLRVWQKKNNSWKIVAGSVQKAG
ncbi:MAG TPA: DUF4440 domain-containing protein [Cyanobacteria bacterium UBA9971]|nr:DUF4440 domain-containing protein [Cyanobacteria bacterium UBA9971]